MGSRKCIGVIGLGSMGRPMALRLASNGYAVTGFDISSSAMGASAQAGIVTASDAAAMAEQCDLVLVMVWDDQALRQVVFGSGGLVAARRLRASVIDLSTTSVAVAREVGQAIAARGGTFMDGAVIGGGVAGLTAGRSPIVLAGERAAYEHCAPMLASLGTCDYVGRLGSAKAVKIVNNFIVGIVTAANAEAVSLGMVMGLDAKDIVQWLKNGPGGSRVLESYMGRYVEDGTYGAGLIGHRLMAKDLQLAAELAESVAFAAVYPRFGQQMYLAFGRTLGQDRPFPSAFDYFRAAADPTARARLRTESSP